MTLSGDQRSGLSGSASRGAPLLSTWERGAAYSLARGDLEACRELAQLHLSHDPYSGVCYTLLALAAYEAEDWLDVAEMSRLAACFGASEPRALSLLAGCYQLIGREVELTWLLERYSAYPRPLEDRISASEREAIARALGRPPRFPRRAKSSAEDPRTVMRPALSTFQVTLPEWLSASTSLELLAHEGLGEPPEWLTSTSDWADHIDLDVGDLPDWMERPPSLEEVFMIGADAGNAPPQRSSPPPQQSAVPTPTQREPSSLPNVTSSLISPPPSLPELDPPVETEISLNSALSTATRLGLSETLEVALDVERVQLKQGGSSRELIGPLLICQDAHRLILIAYQGDQPRQNPWAFTPTHLVAVHHRSHGVELTLQGERTIFAELSAGREALARALSIHLESWRLTARPTSST